MLSEIKENSVLGIDDFEGERIDPPASKTGQKEEAIIDYLQEIGISKELQRLSIVSGLKMEDAKPDLVHDVSISHHMERFIEEHKLVIEQREEKIKW